MALPDYIIIGAQRCGTTSMMRYVGAHPGVDFVAQKEVDFFHRHYSKGRHWYGRQLGKRRAGLLYGEKSAHYLFDPRIPDRIAKTVPNVKLICLLRNPIDRALSGYYLDVHLGREKGKFHEAIRREGNLLLARGRYAEQLRHWLGSFPRILILGYEDMVENPRKEYGKVLKYLDLPAFEPKFARHAHLTKKGMHRTTRRWLVEYFKPYNEELYELLGRDFGWDG